MKAIILGAGRIGRGFVCELLLSNYVEVVFFDASDDMVKALNEKKEYTIHVLGNEELSTKVENVKAYSIHDIEQLATSWEESDMIFTACGGKNMPAVGETLGKAFRLLLEKGAVHTSNIITCENWIDPATDLKTAILETLNDEESKDVFEKNTGVSESVILCTGTGAPDPSKVVNEMDTWVQNLWYLPVDKSRIVGDIPQWNHIQFIDNFGNLLKQKIYTNNTSVASVAFFGRLRGIRRVADAANHPDIEPLLDKVYEEINAALINGMGIDEKSQLEFSKNAKAKYTDYNIVDDVTRIARDPIRKLGPEDRLIGPLKMALKAGVQPKTIALATAAALYYQDPEDADANKLVELRKEKGIDYILTAISKLEKDEEATKLIKKGIEELKQRGWIEGDA